MYDGNQVLRFENKFKASDLGGLGIELTERKGTGNYDLERTQFNVQYVPLINKNLSSQVYKKLKDNNIYFNEGKNVNLLNGAIITSGQEFFQSMGMKFKNSDRIHQVGKKKGQPILIPDIQCKDDIPEKVKAFFDDSFNFLEKLVGKENIVYAEVHYDEDTPHMHFYFLPIVNEVKRKVFETDKNGNLIKHEVIGKDGNKKLLPIQKKDENGKNMYVVEKGKFLNCDQFWKNKGGKTSYAKIQDDYNKFITEKGFNLYRGNIGANVFHKTKAQKEIDDLNEQITEMKKEIEKNKKLNDVELKTTQELLNINSNDVLNPTKKKFGGYKENDVNELITYSKNINKENTKNINTIRKKDITIEDMKKQINDLESENEKLKDGRAIKEKDSKIKELNATIEAKDKLIKEKNTIINNLEKTIEKIQKTFEQFKENIYNFCDKLCKAIAHLQGNHELEENDIDYDEFEVEADKINRKHEKNIEDDFEITM